MAEELHRVDVKCCKCNEDMQVNLNAKNYDDFKNLQCYFTCNPCLREDGREIAFAKSTLIEMEVEMPE